MLGNIAQRLPRLRARVANLNELPGNSIADVRGSQPGARKVHSLVDCITHGTWDRARRLRQASGSFQGLSHRQCRWKVEFHPPYAARPYPQTTYPMSRSGGLEEMSIRAQSWDDDEIQDSRGCSGCRMRETLPRPRRVLAKPMGLSTTLHLSRDAKSKCQHAASRTARPSRPRGLGTPPKVSKGLSKRELE